MLGLGWEPLAPNIPFFNLTEEENDSNSIHISHLRPKTRISKQTRNKKKKQSSS
jgi:hypothetical protein